MTGNFPDVEIGLNRRTWTMLLDFFGALGGNTSDVVPDQDVTAPSGGAYQLLEALLYGSSSSPQMTSLEEASHQLYSAPKKPHSSSTWMAKLDYFYYMFSFLDDSYSLQCDLDFVSVKVFMNYPENATQLGHLLFDDASLQFKVIWVYIGYSQSLEAEKTTAKKSRVAPKISDRIRTKRWFCMLKGCKFYDRFLTIFFNSLKFIIGSSIKKFRSTFLISIIQ